MSPGWIRYIRSAHFWWYICTLDLYCLDTFTDYKHRSWPCKLDNKMCYRDFSSHIFCDRLYYWSLYCIWAWYHLLFLRVVWCPKVSVLNELAFIWTSCTSKYPSICVLWAPLFIQTWFYAMSLLWNLFLDFWPKFWRFFLFIIFSIWCLFISERLL